MLDSNLPEAKPTVPELRGPARWAMRALAWTAMALAVLGAFLPVLPTVPFLLLAGWAAARSSPRLSRWLDQHPQFGPLLRDWRTHGAVSRRSKILASVMMGASALVIGLVVHRPWVAGLAIGCMAVVLAWLWRRPERPAAPAQPTRSGSD